MTVYLLPRGRFTVVSLIELSGSIPLDIVISRAGCTHGEWYFTRKNGVCS